MDRRTALATAGAIAIVTVTGASAIAANVGVLSRSSADPVGQLQPADPAVTTVLVEPTDASPAAARVAVPARPGEQEDDEYEDSEDRDEYEERGQEEEYEGSDDDD